MKITHVGHKYAVLPHDGGKYLAIKVLSEHENLDDAIRTVLDAMKKESEEIMKREIEKLRERGIKAVSFKEAMEDVTPGQKQRFIAERNRKFIDPLLNLNIEMLERKEKRFSIKRIK